MSWLGRIFRRSSKPAPGRGLLVRMLGFRAPADEALAMDHVEKGTVPPELWTLLVQAATDFALVGRWGPDAWTALAPAERLAVIEGARRHEAAVALERAAAARGGMEAAEVAATLDGGKSIEVLKERAHEAALGDLRTRTYRALTPRPAE
ncbi:MAG TPA: hypothetical protein VEA38_12105 [Terriglobales bacterium]|nr:hypothetical protein [Terriglobales bacterium]